MTHSRHPLFFCPGKLVIDHNQAVANRPDGPPHPLAGPITGHRLPAREATPTVTADTDRPGDAYRHRRTETPETAAAFARGTDGGRNGSRPRRRVRRSADVEDRPRTGHGPSGPW